MYREFYYAKVVDRQDPEGRGRVKVDALEYGGNDDSAVWARVLAPYAGDGRGVQFVPEVGDEVLVAFPKGIRSEPVVLGSLFSAGDDSPAPSPEAKVIRSRAGHEIRFCDKNEGSRIEIKTSAGHRLALNDADEVVELKHSQGHVITLKPSGVEVTSSGTVTISGSVVELKGSITKVDAPILQCSGVVKCSTLQATSVVASSYTPGSGNIW